MLFAKRDACFLAFRGEADLISSAPCYPVAMRLFFRAPFPALWWAPAPAQAQGRVEEYGQDLEPFRGYRLVSNRADGLSFGSLLP